jgi:DNA-K related protein
LPLEAARDPPPEHIFLNFASFAGKIETMLAQRRGFSETWKRFWECRKESADHEEAWLILAGFLLRPGFGAAADDFRIDSLWRRFSATRPFSYDAQAFPK